VVPPPAGKACSEDWASAAQTAHSPLSTSKKNIPPRKQPNRHLPFCIAFSRRQQNQFKMAPAATGGKKQKKKVR
jgi:hypothetical protein